MTVVVVVVVDDVVFASILHSNRCICKDIGIIYCFPSLAEILVNNLWKLSLTYSVQNISFLLFPIYLFFYLSLHSWQEKTTTRDTRARKGAMILDYIVISFWSVPRTNAQNFTRLKPLHLERRVDVMRPGNKWLSATINHDFTTNDYVENPQCILVKRWCEMHFKLFTLTCLKINAMWNYWTQYLNFGKLFTLGFPIRFRKKLISTCL